MLARMTLLMAVSHSSTFAPHGAGGGSACTWDTSLPAAEAALSLLDPGTAGTRGPQQPETLCSVALQGCLAVR